MAKNKLGKFLLFTAAVGTAAAAACYFIRKKDSCPPEHDEDDEDYDDFSDELDDEADSSSRTYVPLSRESTDGRQEDVSAEAQAHSGESKAAPSVGAGKEQGNGSFTPLNEQTEEHTEEKVEEFFDEEDAGDAEPPITDN